MVVKSTEFFVIFFWHGLFKSDGGCFQKIGADLSGTQSRKAGDS